MADRTRARPGAPAGPSPQPAWGTPAAPPPARPSVRERAPAYALVLLLTVLLALWGSFLVPLRIGGEVVPVSWALAVVGNLALGRAGGRLAGPLGALVPGLLWVVLVFVLAAKRSEGDLVVPGTTVGAGFLLIGALTSAVAFGLAVVRPVVSAE